MKKIIASAMFGALIGSVSVQAQVPPPPPAAGDAWADGGAFWAGVPADVDMRLSRFEDRVINGARVGSLNKAEAKRIQNEITNIRAEAASMKSRDGGMLNQTDAIYIQGRLDHLGSTIHALKKNWW